MTLSELEHFRNLLTARENSLADWMNSFSLSNENDAGKVRSLLAEIKDALERVEHQTYGCCTVCDGEMAHHRLEVQPLTEICLDCLSKQEKATLEDELLLTGKIYRALLPQTDQKIDGFEVAVKSLAIRNVGGDYYDFLPAPNGGAVRVIIADTMGKGLPAGLILSNFQGVQRILAEEIESPGLLITRLNKWLCRNVPVTKFISLACIALEPNSGGDARFIYTNAGHCPSILVRNDGTVERLEPTGGVLGVHEDFTYDERTLSMSTGDLLLLYTDGVTEAENHHGEMFEENRLIEFVQTHRTDSFENLLNVLTNEVQLFSEKSELVDDFTVIALRKQT
jgi:sigma-B regulation protein RsbU (phosphoserine phosphatase)